jgi:alkylation response protein AidB-like acyl-CoA dehydrogenase
LGNKTEKRTVSMDFETHYTKEREEFREEVRTFIEENAYKEPTVPADPALLTSEMFLRGKELERKLGEKGWYAPGYPKEYGGGGLDIDRCVILAEEFAKVREERRWPGWTEVPSLHAAGIMAHGTEDQKKRLLAPLLRGEWHPAQCFTEAEAGTDEASMKSTAVREGNVYIINGTKVFVGIQPIPPIPDYLYWPAVTDPTAPRHQNLSAFYIPGDLPGITYTALDLYACEGQKWEMTCEDVRCPADRLVGEENKGWLVTTATLAAEHGGGGAIVPRNRLVLRLIDYCKKTLRNGQPLSNDPKVQDILVHLYTEYQVGRLWGIRNFAMSRRQLPRVPYTGTQTALHEKLLRPEVGRALVDILGPYCLTDDPELQVLAGHVEYMTRWADVTHPGGTVEAQKIMMSRGLGLGRGTGR